MAKEFAKKFYNSKKWERCRDSFIEERVMIDGGLCEVCQEVPGYIVHHKIILTEKNINNPDIALSWDNLQYVCKKCHDKFEGHGVGHKVNAYCIFDDDGQPIPVRDIDYPPLSESGD